MVSKTYDFHQFQAELAALDGSKPAAAPVAKPTAATKAMAKPKPLSPKAAAAARLARAREDFLALRERHQLSVADVVAFFPEEEGIAYLQQLLSAAEQKPRRRKSPPT